MFVRLLGFVIASALPNIGHCSKIQKGMKIGYIQRRVRKRNEKEGKRI
jgi:hypothetical protein